MTTPRFDNDDLEPPDEITTVLIFVDDSIFDFIPGKYAN